MRSQDQLILALVFKILGLLMALYCASWSYGNSLHFQAIQVLLTMYGSISSKHATKKNTLSDIQSTKE